MSTQTLIYETFGYSVWFTPANDEFIHAAANRQNLYGNLATELTRVKRQLTTVPNGLESLVESLCDYLPHGSGIDYTWDIIITPSFIPNTRAQRGRKRKMGYLVTCENDYHGMDHGGGYNGTIGGFVLSFWLDDELTPLSTLYRYASGDYTDIDWKLTFNEKIGKLVRLNAKEYQHSDDDDEFYGVDWEGIQEYLNDVLPSALQEWFKSLPGGVES